MTTAGGPDEVLPNLFVGTEFHARSHSATMDLVVNCTEATPFFADGPENIRLAVRDDEADSYLLFKLLRDGRVLEKIQAKLTGGSGGRVLVHCQMGAQRSPAVVASFLVAHRGYDVDDAIAYLRSKRREAFFWKVNMRGTIELARALRVHYARPSSTSQTWCTGSWPLSKQPIRVPREQENRESEDERVAVRDPLGCQHRCDEEHRDDAPRLVSPCDAPGVHKDNVGPPCAGGLRCASG